MKFNFGNKYSKKKEPHEIKPKTKQELQNENQIVDLIHFKELEKQ